MNSQLKILLIDDEPLVRDELGGLLADEGYLVVTASDGEKGLAAFRSEAPDMVITDVRMPQRDGISVAMTIKQEAPLTPVSVITGHGNEQLVLDALRAGVTDFIKKPVRFEELLGALIRMEGAIVKAQEQLAELPRAVEVIERTWSCRLGNELSIGPLFVDGLLRRAISGIDARTLGELSVALRELLINAIEHGNLALTYEEKTSALESGSLNALLEERSQSPLCSARRTHVDVRRSRDTLEVRIRDDGNGFDVNSLPDPTDPSYLLADHGRGVLLATMSVDSLTYNSKGNEVRVVKTLPLQRMESSPPGSRSGQWRAILG